MVGSRWCRSQVTYRRGAPEHQSKSFGSPPARSSMLAGTPYGLWSVKQPHDFNVNFHIQLHFHSGYLEDGILPFLGSLVPCSLRPSVRDGNGSLGVCSSRNFSRRGLRWLRRAFAVLRSRGGGSVRIGAQETKPMWELEGILHL